MNNAISFASGGKKFLLPPELSFSGSGVYLIYYDGQHPIYKILSKVKLQGQRVPIYVGKAVPAGWRQGRMRNGGETVLYRRLKEHSKSIDAVDGLDLKHFHCKFAILNLDMSSLIGTLESQLINRFRPIWNSCIDGFGNHDPGKGRLLQARSEWDTVHPGRYWVEKLSRNKMTGSEIKKKGQLHLLNYQ